MRKSELRSENKRLRHREAALMAMNANLKEQVVTLTEAIGEVMKGPIPKRRAGQATERLEAALIRVGSLQEESWDTFKKEGP